jgi:hypothetical protein
VTGGCKEPGWVPLMREILWDSPKLPQALCRDQPHLFDQVEDKDVVAYCIDECNACPELAACKAWADRQRYLHGCVAGEVRLHHKPLKQKKAS